MPPGMGLCRCWYAFAVTHRPRGVRVMKLAEGSRVITMARAPHDDEEEISAVEDDGTAEEGMTEDASAEDEAPETTTEES